MNLAVARIAAVFFATMMFMASIGVAAPEPPRPNVKGLPEDTDAARFLVMIKSVVDRRLLFEPEELAQALHLRMHFKERQLVSQPPKCANSYEQRSIIETTADIENSWFKPGPEGVQNMKFPQAYINPAGEAGAPAIAYRADKSISCVDANADVSHERWDAQLSFSGLSGFACLTPQRLEKFIGARYQMATDGVSFSTYDIPPTDRYGTELQFYFRRGTPEPCALGAEIHQTTVTGNRERRASSKWWWCQVEADRHYCGAHPNLTRDDRDKLKENALKVCGTREASLAREPLAGPLPKPTPRVRLNYEAPCLDEVR